jgi:putative DNA primase/helicase
MNENPHRIRADAAGAVSQKERNQNTAPSALVQSPQYPICEWALAYARRGLAVFPLHSIRSSQCTCRTRDCGKNTAKHPRVSGGYKAATTDLRQIADWWRKWPDANIGVATGTASGFIVLDIDGYEALSRLRRLAGEHEPLPKVPVVRTARGWHLWFRPSPGVVIPSSAGDGLDVRGEGGYVVVPPSVHATGHVYEWWSDVA